MQSKFWLCERFGDVVDICHANNPEITLNWNNLEALCLECHNREHGYFAKSEEEQEYYFNAGQLVPVRKD